MKIHGQNLSAIFRRLPWQYQLVTLVGSVFILLTIMHVAGILVTLKKKALAPVTQPAPFYFLDGVKGALDPSLAARPHDVTAWMAFTAQKSIDGQMQFEVNLASADASQGCKLWASQPNLGIPAKKGRIIAPDGQTTLGTGWWRVETPSLVYDPDDKGREWKLFAFKYFWAQNPADRLSAIQHYGVITYQYAPDPAQAWSTEAWLFAAKKNYPPPPYDQLVLLDLDRLSPDLQDIVMYARPSAIYQNGVLAMTLSAFKAGDAVPDRVILIVSRDNGNSWLYAGTLLDHKNLAAFDQKGRPPYTRIFGATLLRQDGKIYLAAALGNGLQRGAGTLLFAFDDLASGKLQLDPKTGAPAVLNYIPLPAPGSTGPIGGGTVAYTDDCAKAGMMISQQKGASSGFTIYQTGRPPVAPPH